MPLLFDLSKMLKDRNEKNIRDGITHVFAHQVPGKELVSIHGADQVSRSLGFLWFGCSVVLIEFLLDNEPRWWPTKKRREKVTVLEKSLAGRLRGDLRAGQSGTRRFWSKDLAFAFLGIMFLRRGASNIWQTCPTRTRGARWKDSSMVAFGENKHCRSNL